MLRGLAQDVIEVRIVRLFAVALLGRARVGSRLCVGILFLARSLLVSLRLARAFFPVPARTYLDVAEEAADRLADRFPLELLLQGLADLLDGLSGFLGIGEHALDLGLDGGTIERALDAHGHGEAGESVGAALPFRSRNDLGIRQHVNRALRQIHGARRSHLEQRTCHLEIARFGNAVLDGEAAAEIAERSLVARTPAQFRNLALADLADHFGEVDAIDRTIAYGEAALAFKRGLYLLGGR